MHPPKVLIVENELLIASEISLILEDEGFITKMGVKTVSHALDLLHTEKFDLVLIDINLDGSYTGCDIGRYLLQLDTTPFIYITALYDPETIELIKTTRPQGIIIKPFKPIDIITTTAIVLNNYFYKEIDVLRNTEVNENTKTDIPFVLKKIISFIDQNIYEKIDVEQLTQMTNWSKVHFTKMFIKYLGVTPYKFVLSRKIEQSKILITQSDLSMLEIAHDLGFESYSSFYKAFKVFNGESPEKFKKRQEIKKFLK